MHAAAGPDFICVGMPKAGTGWLYDQLDAHPDFWMPPVKELVYLNRERPQLAFVGDRGERAQGRRERIARKRGVFSADADFRAGERLVHRVSLDERDVAFLKHAATGRGKPRDLDFYAHLFDCKGDLLSGDITPPYCNLPEDMIAQLAERFPQMKVLLLLREPVERVWSRICMSYESNAFDTDLLQSGEDFRTYVQGSKKLSGRFATTPLQRWQAHGPGNPFRFFFFDDLVRTPQQVRRDILQFLGADPEKQSGSLPASHNRKAKKKLEMTPLARDVLVEYFRDEILASAELFGGPARDWPARYGL